MEARLNHLEEQIEPPPGNAEALRGFSLDRRQLANRLNALHFRQGKILVTLAHRRFGRNLTVLACPQPCDGERGEAFWDTSIDLPQNLDDYDCINFLLNDGQRSFAVVPSSLALSGRGLSFFLPEGSRETAKRHVRRHPADDVPVQFIQSGTLFAGRLVDFTPLSLSLQLTLGSHQSARWINPSQPAELILGTPQNVLYAGSCQIVRQQMSGLQQHTLVVAPTKQSLHRYRHKEFRSRRQSLVPAPCASFRHPLSGRQSELLIQDLSGSGLSVEERISESSLVPGLLIPEMRICFTERFVLEASVQVLYRQENAESGTVRCGLTFLDMSSEDHLQLLAMLHRADDAKAYLSHHVDVDRLIDFFFSTGFLYPTKYVSIAPKRDDLRATYEKLYSRSPSIARHFVHQEKGQILAHMSAIRFHENAWMIHHHAADSTRSLRSGLNVLNQMGRWVNDSRNIPSVHLDYFYMFFRDTNRFPMRVFGGIAYGIDDPSVCSLDTFAYHQHQAPEKTPDCLRPPWNLSRATPDDLRELGFFYDNVSGGLLLKAMDLLPGSLQGGTLEEEFRNCGFRRERHLFSLRKGGLLKAVFIVNLADFGLNLSELTSSITAIVLDSERLPREHYDQVLSLLCHSFERSSFPVLLYPQAAAAGYALEHDRNYCQFIFDAAEMDRCFTELQKIIHTIRH